MPTLDTATVYPGSCLVEATNASEGRGTTRPFEIVGAPWVDGEALAHRLGAARLPGVRFRAVGFQPSFQKHAGKRCGGVQIHVTDRETFRSFETGMNVVAALREEGGERFSWRKEPYEFVADVPAIDLLTGSDAFRIGIERGRPVAEIAAEMREAERAFDAERREFLLYD
jgi:uncharacterized protein YbbC (DUF1343 family)